ncbi:MAG: helix-turn-helix transcriptional regulator [Clostridia bacterium]|nr:helix-turn-helix transcriptional regulator [Clostridia bacterium]
MRMVLDYGKSSQVVAVNYSSIRGNNMPRCHSHSCYELYYITDGERYLLVGDRFYHLIPGDIFLISPGIEHRTLDVNNDTYTRFTASIDPSVLPINIEKRIENGLHIVRPDPQKRAEIDSEAMILLHSINSDEQGIEALSAVIRMIYLLLSERCDGDIMAVANPTLDRMSGILEYLDNHYTESVNINALSEKFYISEFYLCRLFKEYAGKTILSYLTELRIKHACKLLRTTNEPIKRVARLSGYGSVSAFGKAFSSLMGESPRDYRRGYGVSSENKIKWE